MHDSFLCCVVYCAARYSDGLWHIISSYYIKKAVRDYFSGNRNTSNSSKIINSFSFIFKNAKDITIMCSNVLKAKNFLD